MEKKVQVTAAMSAQLDALLAVKGGDRFRRSDLAARLYNLTNPRSRPRSDALADAVIKVAAKAGKIVRTGHQHWVRASAQRTLRSGRGVAEVAEMVKLPISTYCPDKWVSVDMETGSVWVGTAAGWKRAPAAISAELKALFE